MKEVNLKEIMDDNGPVSSDYYNQMLARPEKMRGGANQIEMSYLDRKIIERSSNNIKRLLKKIDMNSEHFLKWVNQKELEEKNQKGNIIKCANQYPKPAEEAKIVKQKSTWRHKHNEDSDYIDDSDEERLQIK